MTITRSLTRAITQSLTRKPTDPGLGGGGDTFRLSGSAPAASYGTAYSFTPTTLNGTALCVRFLPSATTATTVSGCLRVVNR